MKQKKIAIIQFPGSNCERETFLSAEYFGLNVEIIRWNQDLTDFSAYILPGGFSFQDRISAGVISAKLPIMKELKKEAEKGKPVLGICNGCQILATAGFFPNLEEQFLIETALAPNTRNQESPLGFVCDWVYVKFTNPKKNVFTRYFDEKDVLPIQINHGEGRFILKERVRNQLKDLAHLTYTNEKGEVINEFPVNPNGSELNLAGLSNAKGNVFAMMPHPERACFLKQIPTYLQSDWSEQKQTGEKSFYAEGPWAKMFLSLADYLGEI